jgi:hypothetical protein
MIFEMFSPEELEQCRSMFTPSVTLYCLEEWRGEQRISPPGYNFTGDKIHPRGTTSPLGDNLAPRGEVNGPLSFMYIGTNLGTTSFC